MASLFNIIKSGPNQLAEQSQEETQQLANKTNQVVAPSTPQMAANLGANPNQQKMAGSSAQLKAEARQGAAQAGAQSERQQQRTFSGQRGLTPEEQQRQEMAAKLSGLSFLGAGVQNAFNQSLNAAQASGLIASNLTPENTFVSSHPELSKLPAAQQEAAKGLIQKVGAGDSSPEDLAQLGSLMGITDQSKLGELTDSIRNKMFNPQDQQTGNLTAQQVQDRIQFSDIDRTSMEASGLGVDSLATELGVAPGDLLKLTPQELSSRVAFVTQRRFDRTESLKNILQDPTSSNEEMQAALDGLKELGVTGVSRFEKLQKMTQGELDQADFVVSPNGETMHLEDALSDDSLTQLAMDALGDPQKMAALQASNPGLAAAIQRNAQLIEQKYAQMDEDVKTFEKLQASNRSDLTASGLSDSTMSALGINTSKIASKSYSELLQTKPGAATIFNKKDPQVSSSFNQVFAANPAVGDLIATATPQDLTASGLDSPAGMAAYAEYANQTDMLDNFSEDSPPAVVLAGVGLNPDNLNQIILNAQAAAAFSGEPIPKELADYQKDPSTGNALALAQSILKPGNEFIKPADLLGFGGATKENLTVDGRMNKLQSDALSTPTAAFQNTFRQYLKDGEFSSDDMQSAATSNLNSFFSMYQDGNVSATIKDRAVPALQKAVTNQFDTRVNSYLNGGGQEEMNRTFKGLVDRGAWQEAGKTVSEFFGPTGFSTQVVNRIMQEAGLPPGSDKFLDNQKKSEILGRAFKPAEDVAMRALVHEVENTKQRAASGSRSYWDAGIRNARDAINGLRTLYQKTGNSAGLASIEKTSAELEATIGAGDERAAKLAQQQAEYRRKRAENRSGK